MNDEKMHYRREPLSPWEEFEIAVADAALSFKEFASVLAAACRALGESP